MQKKLTTKNISQKRLKEVLFYDPETGIWRWLVGKARRVKEGMIAGSLGDNGYRLIGIDYRLYRANRLAWLYMEGYFPEYDVDHENRIRDDDRWSNLRDATRQCNNRNRRMLKNNTSGITGVAWHKRDQKWGSKISVGGKQINLCYSKVKTDAVIVRWEAEKKYDFPNCNTTSSAYLYLKENGLVE